MQQATGLLNRLAAHVGMKTLVCSFRFPILVNVISPALIRIEHLSCIQYNNACVAETRSILSGYVDISIRKLVFIFFFISKSSKVNTQRQTCLLAYI